ncbi:type II secretion system protein [Patescibacteria group bacterium]
MFYKKISGFTLIELLVVITIIAILVLLAILALNSSRAKARDSQRKANLNSIQTSIESYNDDNNHYPKTMTESAIQCYSGNLENNGTEKAEDPNCLWGIKSKLSLEKWLEDPRNGEIIPGLPDDGLAGTSILGRYRYGYNSDDNADTFVLGCTLETGEHANDPMGYTVGNYFDEDPVH